MTNAALRFIPAPAPTREALAALVARVVQRTMKWLRKKRYLRDSDDRNESNDERALCPLEALASMAMQKGTMQTLADSDSAATEEDAPALPKKPSDAVTELGFNLHAGVAIAASDDMGRERLAR